ncbi:unnamed protein product [Linum tenue]|uniref:TPX2 central domain-containing protein n=1 Tax=Linum tenue TaxID=586396 RepID=A0AAV0QNT8_9ROSI|nr:unnamed protein product [Linum tenue]
MDVLEDREAEEFFYDPFSGVEEFDLDYEFDAPKFHDFTKPEPDSDADEAQGWLDVAAGYPPSPLALKMCWRPLVPPVDTNPSSSGRTNSSVEDEDNDESGSKPCDCKCQPKSRAKSPAAKKRSSSFMNPTASHLAKKLAPEQIQCERLLRRFPKDTTKSEGRSSRSSSTSGIPATKRQKLEAGYLRKGARLKHQALFPHKESNPKGVNKASSRPKATVPVQPNLATAIRAERRRSKTKLEFEKFAKPSTSPAKTRPLNGKFLIFTPTLLWFGSFIRLLPCLSLGSPHGSFQNFKQSFLLQGVKLPRSKSSSERHNRELTSGPPQRDKQERQGRTRSLKTKELKSTDKRRYLDEPPVDEFNQLSLASQPHSATRHQTKVHPHPEFSKENTRRDSNQEKEMKPHWPGPVILHHCGNEKTISSSLGCHMNNNRSMPIH